MEVKLRKKHFFIMIGWAIMLSAVCLQAFYARSFLALPDWVLLTAVSILAGLALVDAEAVVLVYFGAFMGSLVITFVCLTMPATIGILEHAVLREALNQQAIVLIVRTLVPFPMVSCFVSGLIGGVIGEQLKLS